MAMLAASRQRKRYHLAPRGKALYEDENCFGTKMLEKMGWEKGKGLGAKEDGTKDFIRVRYKNDSLGLGFEDRDDQWTQHEQSFNGLLQSLNNDENKDEWEKPQANESESEDNMPRIGFGFQDAEKTKKPKAQKLKEKISGVSLEEKSKNSKARVHYKKFIKGKDLAQYSEKDLANIFGKKAADDQPTVNDFYKQVNTKDHEEQESIYKGVPIINTGVSVNDYFKTKMECLKKRKNGADNEEYSENKAINFKEEQLEEGISKKKKKGNKYKKDQDIEADYNIDQDTKVQDSNEFIANSNVSVNDYFKMKVEAVKNKKKSFIKEEIMADENSNNKEALMEEVENKKKKKYKKDMKDEECTIELESAANIKKKKSKNSKTENTVETVNLSQEEDTKTNKKSDKAKKQRHEDAEHQDLEFSERNKTLPSPKDDSIETDLTTETSKKKLKKSKTKETTAVIEIEDNDAEMQLNPANKNKEHCKRKTPSITNQAGEASSRQSKKSKEKDVSSAKNAFRCLDNIQELDLDELKKKYFAFNIYPISSFCAEKFRNISLNDFNGSILPQIEGYGLSPELQLDVQFIKNDKVRITNLWKSVLNKYIHLDKPKKTYRHYVENVINARKTKQKRPKLYVKTWQRKSAFQII